MVAPRVDRRVELKPEDSCVENPVLKFQRALEELGPGQTLEVITHGADHTFLVQALAQRQNLRILDLQEEGPGARIYLGQGERA